VAEIAAGSTDTEAFARISSEVRRWWTVTPEKIEHDRSALPSLRDWLALVDGEPVATAMCVELPDMRESAAAYAGISVLGRARRRGVGSQLYRLVSERARELGKSELECFTFEDDTDGVTFAEHRGFTVVMRVRALRLVLATCPVPTVELPEGVTITTLAERPDLDRGLWETACEAMPDMPYDGDAPFHPGTFDEFRGLSLSGPQFIPEATFMALADSEVIAYGQLGWNDRERGIANHDMLAVRRAFRGRGVAGALKAAQIAWALEHGLTELRTGNEERNAAARAVNARYPYEPIPDGILLRGPLAVA
jgi:mycothiol synthase